MRCPALVALLLLAAAGEDVMLSDDDVVAFRGPEDLMTLSEDGSVALLVEKFAGHDWSTSSPDVERAFEHCKYMKMGFRECAGYLEHVGGDAEAKIARDALYEVRDTRQITYIGGGRIGHEDDADEQLRLLASQDLHNRAIPRLIAAPTASEDIKMLAAPGATAPDVSAFEEFGRALAESEEVKAVTDAIALAAVEETMSGPLVVAGALPAGQLESNWTSWAAKHAVALQREMWVFTWTEDKRVEAATASYALSRNATRALATKAHNATAFEDLRRWFGDNGGTTNFLEVKTVRGRPVGLTTTEEVGDDDVLINMPMKLALCQASTRVVSVAGGRLNVYMKKTFEKNEEWGLALFLIHEWSKGEHSFWDPYIKMLRMTALSSRVLEEAHGTFLPHLLRELDDEVCLLLKWLRAEQCRGDAPKICGPFENPWNLRWALSIVRRYAVSIRRRTTGNQFLALVPMLHLLPHQEGAGDDVFMELDFSLSFRSGGSGKGVDLACDRGNFSDAEQLLRFSRVQEEENGFNYIATMLPGVKHVHEELREYPAVSRVRDWRDMLRLPPRQRDLYDAAQLLMLYGDGTDDDEKKYVQDAGVDERLVEYALEVGAAATAQEATALVVTGDASANSAPVQMYAALEPENEKDRLWYWRAKLARGFFQMQESMASVPSEPSVQAALNRTKDFYFNGRVPFRGLDAVDKVMHRRAMILEECGGAEKHIVTPDGPSEELWCAVRVHVLSEVDTDTLCPPGPKPYHDMHCCEKPEVLFHFEELRCEGPSNMKFNASQPVSLENEKRATAALRDLLTWLYHALRGGTAADDRLLLHNMLRLEDGRETVMASVLRYRAREKDILETSVKALEIYASQLETCETADGEKEAGTGSTKCVFQADQIRRQREEDERRREEAKLYAEGLRNASKEATVLASIKVALDADTELEFEIRQGEDLDAKLSEFAAKHNIIPESVKQMEQGLQASIPPREPFVVALPVADGLGHRRVLVLEKDANITEAVRRFCIVNSIADYATDDAAASDFAAKLEETAREQYNKTITRDVVLEVPLMLPDGRKTKLVVREGDQHDLESLVLNFIDAHGMDPSTHRAIAELVGSRLPPVIAEASVSVNNMVRYIKITDPQPEAIEHTIREFLKMYSLKLDIVAPLRQQVVAQLHPDILAAPARSRGAGEIEVTV